MKILILILALFFCFNTTYSNEKTLPKITYTSPSKLLSTPEELKQLLNSTKDSKKKKEFNWSKLKPFIHLVALAGIISLYMSRRKKNNNDDEVTENMNSSFEFRKSLANATTALSLISFVDICKSSTEN